MFYRVSCVYLYMFYMFCIRLQNTNLEVWTVVKLRTIVTTSATDTSYRKTHPHYPEWCSVTSQAKPGLLCPSLNDNSAIYQQSKQSLSQCCYPSASLQYSLSASGILYAYTAASGGEGGEGRGRRGVALSPNLTRLLSWSTWNSCPVTVRLGVEVGLNRRLKNNHGSGEGGDWLTTDELNTWTWRAELKLSRHRSMATLLLQQVDCFYIRLEYSGVVNHSV